MSDRKTMEAILSIQPPPESIARVAELGRKADDGTLTADEYREYESFVEIGDLLATLKAKARRYLDENPE